LPGSRNSKAGSALDRVFIFLGSTAALVGVGLGAFGAHGLREKLPEPMMAVYQTAVQYHLIHALGLILIGCIVQGSPQTLLLQAAGWLLLAGILLFSGSLYGLSLTEIHGFGLITPFGGLCLLAGWALLALGIWKRP
jgi:uncharacterized membrane protein YgdD (TMEM256/DUF423 family)